MWCCVRTGSEAQRLAPSLCSVPWASRRAWLTVLPQDPEAPTPRPDVGKLCSHWASSAWGLTPRAFYSFCRQACTQLIDRKCLPQSQLTDRKCP